MTAYTLEYTKAAAKEFAKLERKIQLKVKAAIDNLKTTPRPDGVKKLKGYDDTYRIAIGDFRVIYTISDGKLLVSVIRVSDRKDAYK